VARREVSSRRYAEAVFQLAREENTLDRWSEDLAQIAALMGDPDIARVLTGARVPRAQKTAMIEAALNGRVARQAMNLVLLLEQGDKLHIAPALYQTYQEMLDEHRGIAHATVTTAVPLTDDERSAIAAHLSSMTGKSVDVTPVVDESIIAGVVARIGDQLIDGSTRTKLMALKRRLEGAPR